MPALAAAGATAAFLVALGWSDGGYYAYSWLWGIVFCSSALGVVVVRGVLSHAGRRGLAFLAGILVLLTWTGISVRWSLSPVNSVAEVERTLFYAITCATALALLKRELVPQLIAGIIVAVDVISVGALTLRLREPLAVVNPLAEGRLSEPLGYWNAMGLLAAIGAILAIGAAAHAGRPATRAVATASLVVIMPSLHLTFSRGAWIAFFCGSAVAIALEPRKGRVARTLSSAAPGVLLAIAAAQKWNLAPGEGEPGDSDPRTRFLVAVLLLAITTGLLSLAVSAFPTVDLGHRFATRTVRRIALAVCVAVAVLGLSTLTSFAVVNPNALSSVGENAVRAFSSEQPSANDQRLEARLFSLSGTWRDDLWRSAWDDFETNALIGSGAGTFERYWLEHRPQELPLLEIRDAHNLYLETLAELGSIGFVVLTAVLMLPVVTGLRSRRKPLIAAATGAYTAFLVHAGIDWDWEMPVVTVTAIVCAVAILVAGGEASDIRLPVVPRVAATGGFLALGGLALVALVAASFQARAEGSFLARDRATGRAAAHIAASWPFHSVESWQLVGEIQLRDGEHDAARVSFRRALAEDQGNWESWYGLARASDGCAKEQAYEYAKRLNPRGSELTALRLELQDLRCRGAK